jgi:hypothetical protein
LRATRIGSGQFIGGWQLAGMGSLASTCFQLPADMFPTGNKIELYGYSIQSRTAAAAAASRYLWTNGYIPANRINSYDAKGNPNGVMGSRRATTAYAPLITAGRRPCPQRAGEHECPVVLGHEHGLFAEKRNAAAHDVVEPVPAYNNQFLPGIRTWNTDASLVKNVRFEKWNLRFTADFFNVLNHPGNPSAVSSAGLLQTRNSGNAARQLQLSLRLGW